MTLHDEIATLITDIRHFKDSDEAAELILTLVRAHLTSDEAVERALEAYENCLASLDEEERWEPANGIIADPLIAHRAAITAALGGE